MGIEIAPNRAPGLGAPGPYFMGYKAWSFDPAFATANQQLTTQQVLTVRVPIAKTFSCTKVWYPMVTLGSTLTYARIAIFDAAGTTQLVLSDDLTSAWTSGSTVLRSADLTATTLTGGEDAAVTVAFLAVGTTMPIFFRQVAGGGAYSTMVSSVNPSGVRAGTQAGQTSMPASLSLTLGAGLLWVGLS